MLKMVLGENVELICPIISGNPPPEVMWYKDGIKLNGHFKNGIKLVSIILKVLLLLLISFLNVHYTIESCDINSDNAVVISTLEK